jgi:hypothetical protein
MHRQHLELDHPIPEPLRLPPPLLSANSAFKYDNMLIITWEYSSTLYHHSYEHSFSPFFAPTNVAFNTCWGYIHSTHLFLAFLCIVRIHPVNHAHFRRFRCCSPSFVDRALTSGDYSQFCATRAYHTILWHSNNAWTAHSCVCAALGNHCWSIEQHYSLLHL